MKDEFLRKAEVIEALQMCVEYYKFEHEAHGCAIVEWCETLIPGKKVMEVLRNLPTNAVPIKQGKWIHYKDEHTCSLCYGVVTGDWDDEDYYEYCPFCGARMDDHDYQGW